MQGRGVPGPGVQPAWARDAPALPTAAADWLRVPQTIRACGKLPKPLPTPPPPTTTPTANTFIPTQPRPPVLRPRHPRHTHTHPCACQECEACGKAARAAPKGGKRGAAAAASSLAAAAPLSYCSACGAVCHPGCMAAGRCALCVAGLKAVEAVLGCRTTQGRKEYYLKFKEASYR